MFAGRPGCRPIPAPREGATRIAFVGMGTRELSIGLTHRVGGANDDLAIGSWPDAVHRAT